MPSIIPSFSGELRLRSSWRDRGPYQRWHELAAADHANVTFEVDYIDQQTRSGWSVLVRGLAEGVTSEHRDELVERTKASGVQPWAPGHHGHWMRLISHSISGRRIVPGELDTEECLRLLAQVSIGRVAFPIKRCRPCFRSTF